MFQGEKFNILVSINTSIYTPIPVLILPGNLSTSRILDIDKMIKIKK